MKRKVLISVVLICVFATALVLTACGEWGNEKEATSFVTLDINPSIELTLDKRNKVISVYGANEDGQVLLYNETDIIGKDVEEATQKILELASQMGYLDESNSVVEATVTSEGKAAEAIYGKIETQVSATAEKLNVNISCTENAAYSLMRKMEQYKKRYPENEKVQSLTPNRFKLVISAAESGEISFEAAVEMNNAELIKAVSAYHEEVENYATQAYREIKAAVLGAYDKAVGLSLDGVYSYYYATHLLAHPTTAYYGGMYQAYKTTYRAFNVMADALLYVEKINDKPLDKAQIENVLSALGLTDINVKDLENTKGEVTVNSVYAYADKVFKNSDISANLEELKKNLDTALTDIETVLQKKTDEISLKYKEEIEQIKKAYDGFVNTIVSMINALPSEIKDIAKQTADAFVKAGENLTYILQDGKITSDEIRAAAKSMNDKADEILKKIESDLSAEELKEIETLKNEYLEKTSAAKTEMEEAIAKAEDEARALLEKIKSQRLNLAA